jgi:hypothetical protein
MLIVDYESGKMWKEAIMAYFKLSEYFHGRTEEKSGRPSLKPVSWSRFEPDTARSQAGF